MPIYRKVGIAIVVGLLSGTAHAKNRILPDACGSDAVQFDIAEHKADPPPNPPAEGKTQIVFIQTLDIKNDNFIHPGITKFPTRFGLDGAWVGAAANNSYFTVDVAPGEHHLCGSVQGSNKQFQDMVAAKSTTVEAGKVYYYEFKILKLVDQRVFYTSDFREIEPDDGKFRIKASTVSVATPHK